VTQVLGTDAVGTAQRLLEHEVAIVPEQVSNTLLLSASPRYFDQIHEIIEELDQPQSQVLIQVMLAEVTLDSTRDLGFEWSFAKNVGGGWNVGTGTDFAVPAALNSFGGYSALLTGNNFNFLLRALENEGRVTVLSRPQILTADNKAASINVGQRVPLITGSQLTPQGGTVNTFDYRDVGVNLTVTPRITGEGFVKIDVGATNSSISSSTVQINDRATVPIINERRASTTVTVQSGQTVVIGGLIGTVDDIRNKKTPFLGDIPGLHLPDELVPGDGGDAAGLFPDHDRHQGKRGQRQHDDRRHPEGPAPTRIRLGKSVVVGAPLAGGIGIGTVVAGGRVHRRFRRDTVVGCLFGNPLL
jgi:type II secretory pathway component GspD/PulD (secretin)